MTLFLQLSDLMHAMPELDWITFFIECSTFGNDLEPTSHWLEVIFSIITVLSGLLLFTLLIGNIQVDF